MRPFRLPAARVRPFVVLVIGLVVVAAPLVALGQHEGHHPEPPPAITANPLINALEAVTGLLAAVVAFLAALAYREGRLGRGMTWVAAGMVIMSIGHFILVAKRFIRFDPLGFLGETGSFVAFSLAVFASFLSSAYGFWVIRRVATAP
jgi:hypothetical protein